MYGKLFASTFTGSMYGAGLHIFAVWGYAIANANAEGYVELTPPLVAGALGCDPSEVERALEYLSSPDEQSRTQAHEGRRILQEGRYLYHIPNYTAYRAIKDENGRREYMRNYMRDYRERKAE